MATKAQVMDALRVERDRIAEQIDGVKLALESGCNNAQLALLLVPGFGVWVYLTARAACGSDSAAGLRRRVAAAEQVLSQIESMGTAVADANEASPQWPAQSRAALDLATAAQKVDVVGDALDAATRLVSEAFAAAKRIPEFLNDIGTGLLAVGVGAGLLFLVISRRR